MQCFSRCGNKEEEALESTLDVRAIKQAVSEESLISILSAWCRRGAGQTSHSLKILTAFVSSLGIAALSPFLDVFLSDGNTAEIIFGIDRAGTDRAAVKSLYTLQRAYPQQVDVKVFRAPARNSIFHPKLYLYENGKHLDFIIGSANLTSGGLAYNLESLLLHEGIDKRSELAMQARSIWSVFCEPRAPLTTDFLKPLTLPTVRELYESLPARSYEESRDGGRGIQDLWQPVSKLPLPKSGLVQPRKRISLKRAVRAFLLMDVLTETRSTQMQIPLAVVEQFFGLGRDEKATLDVSIWTEEGPTQPIKRPLVMSTGPEGKRLMRRLEMPQIKRLKRPLAVLFIRMAAGRFAYHLLPRETEEYRTADRVLRENGQQGEAQRRYVIGDQKSEIWGSVAPLLPKESPLKAA